MAAYDSALLVGRFQTFHIGHQSLVEAGLKLADRLVILVGSSQEAGTERNPLGALMRAGIIREVYPDVDRVIIDSLSDLTNENDIRPEWGTYVMDRTKSILFKAPEIMIYGNDESRSRWFDPEDIKNTSEFIVSRARIPISATMLREYMVYDQREEWMKWVDPKLHKMYPTIRERLMAVPYYRDMLTNSIKKVNS